MLKFDEIENISKKIILNLSSKTKEEVEDSILDLLIMSYMYGTDDANEMLGLSIEPNAQKMGESINKNIKGINYKERVENSLKNDFDASQMEIKRIIDTETHRVYNNAIYNVGISSGKQVYKTWRTMLDGRVRDTHWYLEDVKKPLLEEFYTYDGDYALFPNDFKEVYNNVNCRCFLELSYE